MKKRLVTLLTIVDVIGVVLFIVWLGLNVNQPAMAQIKPTPMSAVVKSTLESPKIPAPLIPEAIVPASTPTPAPTSTLAPTPVSAATQMPPMDYIKQDIKINTYCDEYRSAGGPDRLPSITTMAFVPSSGLVNQALLSCNYRARAGKPIIAIVVHDTVGSIQSTIAHFERPSVTAAQYVIGRDGKIVQMVPEEFAALQVNPYSKGPCQSGQNCLIRQITNDNSIGIELENLYDLAPVPGHPGLYENRYGDQTSDVFVVQTAKGTEYYQWYTGAQIESLVALVRDIVARNPSIQVIVGHEEVNDKLDPGPAFDQFWPLLRNEDLRPYTGTSN